MSGRLCAANPQVRVVASLPCYSERNVDAQRGAGVFERSVAGLKALNQVGYGHSGGSSKDDGGTGSDGLTLDLVYNPGGAFLAPDQVI